MQQRKYGLFTAIAMIAGIVIGSGIFFKSDNILLYTGGNVILGVILFCAAAISIIFGSLSISQLAALTDRPGGFITYGETFVGPRFGTAMGWFQTFIYFPTLSVVLCWVSAIYAGQMFGWDMTLEKQVLLGLFWYIICFLYNTLSPKLGGMFQNASMVIKLIPLIGIAVAGLIWGDPAGAVMNMSTEAKVAMTSTAWLAGIGPIAFSFDGWPIATAIAHEVKDSKKNLPKALVFAPLFVLLAYLAYFISVCATVGPEKVMELGDESAFVVAEILFGSGFAKMLLIFIVISVMGSANGVILGYIRLPFSMACSKMIPKSDFLKKCDDKERYLPSSAVSFAVGLVWWVIHYVTLKYNLLHNSDISEIAIVISYLLYVAIYLQLIRLWREGTVKGKFYGLIVPLIASAGSIFILVAGLQNPMFFIYVIICAIALVAGFFYGGRKKLSK